MRGLAILTLFFVAGSFVPDLARADETAPTRAELRERTRADRCAVEVKAHVNAGRIARARRAIERCATSDDVRWAWLATLWLPHELTSWVRPSVELSDDVARVRRLLARVTELDAASTRLAAWMALVAGEDAWIEIGPQDPEGAAWLRRAAALRWRRGQLVQAERALRLAVRSMPQDPELARDLAAVEVARGRPDDAAARLGIARVGRPDDRALLREQALAWLSAGRGDEALASLEQLAHDDVDGRDTLRLATAALELGRARQAEAAARRALTRLPEGERSAAHAVRGLALVALGRREEARAALTAGGDDVRARSALEALDAR